MCLKINCKIHIVFSFLFAYMLKKKKTYIFCVITIYDVVQIQDYNLGILMWNTFIYWVCNKYCDLDGADDTTLFCCLFIGLEKTLRLLNEEATRLGLRVKWSVLSPTTTIVFGSNLVVFATFFVYLRSEVSNTNQQNTWAGCRCCERHMETNNGGVMTIQVASLQMHRYYTAPRRLLSENRCRLPSMLLSSALRSMASSSPDDQPPRVIYQLESSLICKLATTLRQTT